MIYGVRSYGSGQGPMEPTVYLMVIFFLRAQRVLSLKYILWGVVIHFEFTLIGILNFYIGGILALMLVKID
jgi:hypothetical protein